jgi:ABC-type molybdate transport system substrate-binding protein
MPNQISDLFSEIAEDIRDLQRQQITVGHDAKHSNAARDYLQFLKGKEKGLAQVLQNANDMRLYDLSNPPSRKRLVRDADDW